MSGAPASPAEGKSKSGESPKGVTDLKACLSGCDKLDDTVPPGSKCLPARVGCKQQCNQTFKK
jgi:hypothetical protein